MKTEKNNIDKPILAVLRDMVVNDIVVYPISRMSSIRAMCSNFGLQWNKKFRTKVDREMGTIVVTRLN